MADVYARVDDPRGLAPPERDPASGRRPHLGGSDGDRPGKRRGQTPDPSSGRAPAKRWLVVVAAVVAAVLLIGGAVVALGGGDDSDETVEAGGGSPDEAPGDGPAGTGPGTSRPSSASTTTTRPEKDFLLGDWHAPNGTLAIRITGADAKYTVRVTSRDLGCDEAFTTPPVSATLSGRYPTWDGTENLVMGAPSCRIAGTAPITFIANDPKDPDHLYVNSSNGSYELLRG